jgi:hypothetical protein
MGRHIDESRVASVKWELETISEYNELQLFKKKKNSEEQAKVKAVTRPKSTRDVKDGRGTKRKRYDDAKKAERPKSRRGGKNATSKSATSSARRDNDARQDAVRNGIERMTSQGTQKNKAIDAMMRFLESF